MGERLKMDIVARLLQFVGDVVPALDVLGSARLSRTDVDLLEQVGPGALLIKGFIVGRRRLSEAGKRGGG